MFFLHCDILNGMVLLQPILVFPFFFSFVGVSIVLAFKNKICVGRYKKKLIIKIIRRSLTIFVLGVLLNLIGSDFTELRLPGVLQRIAMVFMFLFFVVHIFIY